MRQKLFMNTERNGKKVEQVQLNKYLKKSISVGLMVAVFLQTIVINDFKVSSKESSKHKDYVIECMSDGQYDKVQKLVGDNDVVLNDEIEGILEDNCIKVVSLSESDVKKIKNTGAVIEEDIVLEGSIKDDLPTASKEELEKQKEEIFGETGKESGPKWNVEVIGVDDTESEKLKKDVVKIAIIDSGIDYSENINVVERMNFFDGEISPLFEDNTGHGTAIAGIIASDGQNGSTKGINPNVDIYSARVLDRKNKAPVSRIVEAIYWAIDKKVNIINISFGTTKYSEVLHNAIKDAKKAGILIFAASGNEGESVNKGTVEYPAAFEEVVSVGATDPSGEVADLTSRDGEVDIVAPGIEITSEGWLGL